MGLLSRWRWQRVVVDDGARITTVPMHRPGTTESIPACVAVLRVGPSA